MMTLTPAEHREQAERFLDGLRGTGGPGSMAWHGYAQAAIGHAFAAVAAYLEPPAEPDIPGLPLGWRITTQQSGNGERKWCYILNSPDRTEAASRYVYGSSGSALFAGLNDPSIPQDNETGELHHD